MNRRIALLLTLAPLAACVGTPGPVCLASYQIRRTEVPDDSTILFVMQDSTVYRNHLVAPCAGLAQDTRGFTYAPTDPGNDTLCSNLVILHANTLQNTCLLGTFEKLSPRPGR